MTIRVAIADDQPMIRDGFRLQVQYAADLEFVGEAADGIQAVELADRERPDVLLMDVRMPAWTASRPPAGSPPTRRCPGPGRWC